MSVYTVNLARALDLAGASVHILGFGDGPPGLELSPNLTFVNLGPDPGFLDWFGGIATTYRYLRRRLAKASSRIAKDADVFHFVYPEALFRPVGGTTWVTATAWGFSSPSEIITDAPKKFANIWKLIGMTAELQFYHLDRQAVQEADAVVCTTRAAARFWGSVSGGPIAYLPVPISGPTTHAEPLVSRRRDETVTFLFAERQLERSRNNLAVLLRALKILAADKIGGYRVILIGGHTSRLSSQLVSLQTAGVELEIYPYLHRSAYLDVLDRTDVSVVLRFIKDQGALWPLEGMARGIPVIASDMPAFHDFVIPGKTGLLVNPYDPCDVAAKMRLLIENRSMLDSMGRGAARFVREAHALEAVGPAYLSFYENMMGTRA